MAVVLVAGAGAFVRAQTGGSWLDPYRGTVQASQGSDSGEIVLDSSVLRVFNQGAPLEVVVTKTREQTQVSGVARANITTTTTATRTLTPAP